MKKIFFLLVVLFCMSNIVAQDDQQGSLSQILVLIEDDLSGNKSLIMNESKFLTDEEKYNMYLSNKLDPAFPILLNVFPGFGAGSFAQGDTTGGIISLVCSFGGISLMGLGELMDLSAYVVDGNSSVSSTVVFLSGAAIFFGGKVFDIVRPLVYSSDFNEELKEALGLHGLGYSIIPTYNPLKEQTEIMVSFNVDF